MQTFRKRRAGLSATAGLSCLQRSSITYDAERYTTRVPKKVHFIFAYYIDMSVDLRTVWHTYRPTTISLQEGDYTNPLYAVCVATLLCIMQDQKCLQKQISNMATIDCVLIICGQVIPN